MLGEPGVGKSTAVAAATALRWPRVVAVEDATGPIPVLLHVDVEGRVRVEEAGRRRRSFSGTDALAMNVMPRALDWLAGPPRGDVRLAEGDRLASDKFLARAAETHDLTVLWLDASPATLTARREARGSTQAEAWIKGRSTKVHRLADEWDAVRVDADRSLVEVAADVAEAL